LSAVSYATIDDVVADDADTVCFNRAAFSSMRFARSRTFDTDDNNNNNDDDDDDDDVARYDRKSLDFKCHNNYSMNKAQNAHANAVNIKVCEQQLFVSQVNLFVRW
jgi:hypothetical protein